MAELKKIVLKIGDKEISLSPNEAKELKQVLSGLFGENVTVKEVHHWDWTYPYVHRGPYWMTTSDKMDPGIVYCSTAISSSNDMVLEAKNG